MMPSVAGLSEFVEGRPISVNSAYGKRRGGGRYLKPEAQAWRDLVWVAFRVHKAKVKPYSLPLGIRCIFYGVRGDGDNYLKLTLDGLKIALGVDDKFFSPATAEVVRGKGYGKGARIEVWPAGVAGREAAA